MCRRDCLHWECRQFTGMISTSFCRSPLPAFYWAPSKLPPSAECLSRNMAVALTPTRNFLHLLHQTLPLESVVVFPSAEACHSHSSMKALVLAHHSQTRSPPASFLSLFYSFHICLALYRSRCLRLSFWWRWLVYSRSQPFVNSGVATAPSLSSRWRLCLEY